MAGGIRPPFFVTMSLIDQARTDTAFILGGPFSVPIVLVSPDSQVANIRGIHNKHHLGVNPHTGDPVNAKKAAVTFAESAVYADNANYPVRTRDEVTFKDHKVKVKDSTGIEKTYKVDQWFPDEMVGSITLILGKYAD